MSKKVGTVVLDYFRFSRNHPANPLPRPATQVIVAMGGRAGEWVVRLKPEKPKEHSARKPHLAHDPLARAVPASSLETTMRFAIAAAISCLALVTFGLPAAAQDVENGRKVFQMCLACHGKDGPGPVLNGIFEKKIGSVEGFEYSEALEAANQKAQLWTEDALNQFLAAPQTYIPENKMAFGAVEDAQQRKDLIAFLKTLR